MAKLGDMTIKLSKSRIVWVADVLGLPLSKHVKQMVDIYTGQRTD